jgi:hypothetical protein
MSWRPLDPNSRADPKLPALLFSAIFRPDSYTIHLTDLTHIWSETLWRHDVFQRSKDENTSIDPRDGDQLRVLLDKIRLGIEGGSSSTLVLTVNDDPGRPGITLNITVDLPGGLHPLEWPVHLTSSPQLLLTEQLMIPLLEVQQMRMREMSSLANILQEKDLVIQKLIDKLDSQGTQLGQVFPQVAGKSSRKSDRKIAEEKVKGLKMFNMEAWRQGLKNDEPLDIRRLAGQVFGNVGPLDINNNSPSHVLKIPEDWWETIKGNTFGIHSSKFTLPGHSKARKDHISTEHSPKEEETVEDDADFQLQATPPHLSSTKQKAAVQQPADDSTEDDDDDLDAPSQRSKVADNVFPSQPPQRSPGKLPKKLGTVDGRRELPNPIPEDDGETTDGSTPSPVRRRHSREEGHKSPMAVPSPAKPKRTIGTIGGKKTPPELEEVPPAKEQVKASRGRLGQIGGKNKEATPSPHQPAVDSVVTPPKLAVEARTNPSMLQGPKSTGAMHRTGKTSEEARGRGVKKEPETKSPPRETSEERANRKREQLRMELAEKAKAPVKKKRKF